jgi:hypothetical protein
LEAALGVEDTDFARTLAERGVELARVGVEGERGPGGAVEVQLAEEAPA